MLVLDKADLVLICVLVLLGISGGIERACGARQLAQATFAVTLLIGTVFVVSLFFRF